MDPVPQDPQTVAQAPDQQPAPAIIPAEPPPITPIGDLPGAMNDLANINQMLRATGQKGWNPKREGRVHEYAQATGFPDAAVRQLSDHELTSVNAPGSLIDAPATRAFMLRSAQHAVLGMANPDELMALEQMSRRAAEVQTATGRQKADNPGMGFWESSGYGFDQAKASELRYRQLFLGDEAAGAEADKLMAPYANKGERDANDSLLQKLLNPVAEFGGMMASTVPRVVRMGATAGTLGAGIGSVAPGVGTISGAMAGARVGAQAGFTLTLLEQSIGAAGHELSQIKDANGQPLDPSVWKPAALAVGAIQTGLMTYGAGILGKLAPKAGTGLAGTWISKALGDATVREGLGKVAGKYGSFLGEQALIGASLESANILGEWASRNAGAILGGNAFTPEERALFTREHLNQAVSAGAHMALTMGTIGAPLVAARLAGTLAKGEQAKTFADNQAEINAATQASQLQQVSPSRMREFQQMAGNGGEVRLDSDVISAIPASITDKLDLRKSQIETAAAIGRDLSVNIEDLQTRLTPDEFKAITPALKMGSGARSLAEAKQVNPAEEAAQVQDVVTAEQAQRAEYAKELSRVRSEIIGAVKEIPALRHEIVASGSTIEDYASQHLALIKAASERQAANGGELTALISKIRVEASHALPDLAKDLGQSAVIPDVSGQQQGRTISDGNTHLVRLFNQGAKSNLSTLTHELGHVFLEEHTALAKAGVMPETMAKDWETLTGWLGTDLRTEVNPKAYGQAHERFARGFEEWLREGKAPEPKLVPVFERFKQWMKKVYQSVTALGPDRAPLTDEVRGVFDRMLAADQEAASAAAEHELLVRTPKDLDGLGLTKEEKTGIIGLLDQAQRAVAAKLDALRTKGREKREDGWRDEAATAILKEPVWQAVSTIKEGGGLKWSRVFHDYGQDTVDALRERGLIAPKGEAGIQPEDIADTYRFETPDALVLALLDTEKNRKEAVEAIVRQKSAEWDARYSAEELMLHTEEYSQYLDQMGQYIARAVGQDVAPIKRQAFHDLAEAKVGEMALDRAIDWKDALEAFKWAQAQERRATAAQDWPKALKYYHRARLNWEMAKVSRELSDLREKAIRKANEAVNAERGTLDEQFHFNLIRVLERFGLLKRPTKLDLSNRQPLTKVLEGPDGDQTLAGMFPDWLIDDNRTLPAAKLSGDDFRSIVDLVQYLNAEGRARIADIVASDGRKRSAVVAALAQPMEGLKAAHIPNQDTAIGRLAANVSKFISGTDQLRFDLRRFDGFTNRGGEEAQAGPNERFALHRLSRAHSITLRVKDEAFKATDEAWKQLGASARKAPRQIIDTGVPVPEIMAKAGQGWTFDRILGVALLMGNDYQREAVKAGYKLTDEHLGMLVAKLSDQDLDAVNVLLRTLDPLFKQANDVFYKVNHFHQEKVKAHQWIGPRGKIMEGGYFPLVPDRTLFEQKAADLTADENADFNAAILPPTTRAGSMKARTDFGGKPPKLSTEVWVRHVDTIAHYIGHEEAVRELDRVYVQGFPGKKGNPLKAMIQEKFGVEAAARLRPTLQRIARPNAAPMSYLDQLVQRQGGLVSAGMLALNVKSALFNLTSAVPLIREVGLKTYWDGVTAAVQPGSRQTLHELSSYMKNRTQGAGLRDRELEAYKRLIKPGLTPSWYNRQKVVEWGHILLSITDEVQNNPAWWGVFKREMSTHGDQAKAVAAADEMVANVNPSARPMDLSAFQASNGSLGRSLLMFSTFRFLYGNRQRYYYQAWKAGKMPTAEYTRQVVLEAVVPPLLTVTGLSLLWGQNPLTQPGAAGNIGGALLTYQLQGLPILNEIGQGAGAAIAGTPNYDPSKASLLMGLTDATNALHDFIGLMGEMDDPKKQDRAVWSFATLASYWAGVPAAQVFRRVKEGMEQWDKGQGTPLNLLIPNPEAGKK